MGGEFGMTFTALETLLMTGAGATLSGVFVKVFADRRYVLRADCTKCQMVCKEEKDEEQREVQLSLIWIKNVLLLLCEKSGISVEKQIELGRVDSARTP